MVCGERNRYADIKGCMQLGKLSNKTVCTVMGRYHLPGQNSRATRTLASRMTTVNEQTNREKFPSEMELVLPWPALIGSIAPTKPRPGRRRTASLSGGYDGNTMLCSICISSEISPCKCRLSRCPLCTTSLTSGLSEAKSPMRRRV